MADQALPLAITPGEPAGIGPDLCIQYAQRAREYPLVAICDPQLLTARARVLGLPLSPLPLVPDQPVSRAAGCLTVQPRQLTIPAVAGSLDQANASYVLDCLREAAAGCLEGRYAALVTGPVHKGIINDAGVAFSGHTEFLAELTGGTPVMMLACPELRVALATTHLPLSQVSAAIDRASLRQVIQVLDRDLRQRFGCIRPRILVCGLNPHAGEGGHLGREELETINPVLDELRHAGLDLQGALPADTLFTPRYLDQADAVLAMYHDQGLPVLKHLGFGRAVNITLGLPVVRTSVDHGTALDLAGSGQADSGSLEAAIQCAWEMSRAQPAGST